ncbi:MAG: NADH-quinone oxidoreductase subunit J [Phycisphaerae bacterium]
MSSALPILIYGLFALGGAGIFLSLPKAGRSTPRAGALLGLAGVALFVVLVASYAAPQSGAGLSYVFSAVALIGSGRVVTHPKPVYCVLYFVLVVVAVACLLVMQEAEFLAVALIIVYAGAILVTYAFVIMLAQQSSSAPQDSSSREPFWAVLAGFVTMAAVAGQVAHLPTGGAEADFDSIRLAQAIDAAPTDSTPAAIEVSNTRAVGRSMLSTYVITLEVAGLLLLVAMVGAIAIAKKRVPGEEDHADRPAPGSIGREVAPF